MLTDSPGLESKRIAEAGVLLFRLGGWRLLVVLTVLRLLAGGVPGHALDHQRHRQADRSG